MRAGLAALDLDPDPAERVALQARTAQLAVNAGEYVLAEELAVLAEAGHLAAGDRSAAATAAHARAQALNNSGRLTEAAEIARTALGWLDDESPVLVRFRLTATLGTSLRWSEPEEYRRTGFVQLKLAEELQDPELLVDALNKLAIVAVDAGGITAYLALMERCVALSREGHLLGRLGRSLSNLSSEVYPRDLARAREVVVEALEVSRRVGDADHTDVALTNAACTWWLAGEWDRLTEEAHYRLDGRSPTGCELVLVMLAQVRLARGEPLVVRDGLPDSEDPWEKHAKNVYDALRGEDEGDRSAAAAAAAASAQETFADLDADALDDFEVGWAPVVELLLRAGDVDGAWAALALAAPLLGGRGRPLTRAEHARLRGTVAAARGEDPEADLRAAERALAAYGAPYLLARTRLELGRWLAGQGRGGEADPLLEAARETFVRLRAAPSLAEVDALRASPAPIP